MKTIVILTVGLLFSLPMALVLLMGAITGAETDRQRLEAFATGCLTWTGETPPAVELTTSQLDRAAAIYQVAIDTGMGARAATIGIATAMQESALGANAAAMAGPNADGDYGLFQQRTLVGWYADGDTVEENIQTLSDDQYQARNFFHGHTTIDGWHIPGLADVDNWQHLSLTEAAQAVQVSAFPDAYAKWEGLATSVVNTFEGNPDGISLCALDAALDCPPTGLAAEQGQTPDALLVMRCTQARYGDRIGALLGVRPGDPRDHGTGRAVDIMIPDYLTPASITMGWEIANWLRAHHVELGITYIIWREEIWSVRRDAEGWRPCANNCYTGPDHSASHRDHIHISVDGHAATGFQPDETDGPKGRATLPLASGSYRLTATFGQQGSAWASGRHTGLDFAAPTGTPLKAVVDGTITAANTNAGAYGMLTKLQARDGTVFYYAHQSSINVRVGQHVTAGQRIGAVGNTGNSFGAHLHFEVRIDGTPVDPQQWLRQKGLRP